MVWISLGDTYTGRIKYLSYATLFLGITETGETFVLPVTEPWKGYPYSWRDSLLEAVNITRKEWVKIDINTQAKCHEIIDQKPSRTQPNWPPESFEEILQEAFPGEFYVDSDDNLVLDTWVGV